MGDKLYVGYGQNIHSGTSLVMKCPNALYKNVLYYGII